MLSLAIVSGAIWADATWGHFWIWEPQESWSLMIWLLYAGLLESRLAAGWRGRRAAALTIAVFTVLLGSFLGVSLAFPGQTWREFRLTPAWRAIYGKQAASSPGVNHRTAPVAVRERLAYGEAKSRALARLKQRRRHWRVRAALDLQPG